MAREDRFEKVFEQGMVNVTEIWVDRVKACSTSSTPPAMPGA